ncbi:MAG TPA: histidine kinase N-terminal domain-containing protein [Actinomycetales bacterium]|nr:histidine kinase N-terminal domain-containing protein [Actinomycetales bacterium]
MPTLNDLVRRYGDLDDAEREWLHLLVGDWQLIADLSFADLVLWLPTGAGDEYVAVAHCRPSTGATVYYEDQVGRRLLRGRRPQLDRAMDARRIYRERDPEWLRDVPVREEAIPVVRQGRVLAVLARHTNLAAARTPSRLELTYLQCADALVGMVASGHFPPVDAPTGVRRGAPRVGDGLITLDADGAVAYASPNALADYHRLGLVGDLVGRSLGEVTSSLLDDDTPVDESLALVVSGRAPARAEVYSGGAALSLRSIPLVTDDVRTGAIVLCRDVSELRRREQELLTKDATIREIHHRVKNNLQTVAALLRLQARRIKEPEAREALQEAIRRVGTIARVHETLSHRLEETVDFDQLLDDGLLLVEDLAGASQVAAVREGQVGTLVAEDATALALVLTELVSNAVEHGLAGRPGKVVVRAERDGQRLRVAVEDDGPGFPAGFAPGEAGLGTQIVSALVKGELRGTIHWNGAGTGDGARVVVDVRLRERRGEQGR